MKNGNLLKSRVSEIRVKRIRITQGVGVYCWTKLRDSGHSELNARRSQRENEHANRIDRTYETRFQGVTQIVRFKA